jgi:hypothetical protein
MCSCKTCGILAKTFSWRKDAWRATCWPRRTLAHRGAGRKRGKADQQMTLRDGGGVKFPPGDCCNTSIMYLSIISNGGFKTGPGEYDATVGHHPRTYPQSRRAAVCRSRLNQYPRHCRQGTGQPSRYQLPLNGKDGLYREVLRTAFRALTKQQLAHAQEMKGMSREKALGEFIRHQLHPLGERGELTRHLRIFNWEAVRPTAVYRKLMSEEAAPFMALAVDLVRRFLPKADQSTLIMAAVWLVGQCSIFVRNREQLANPPVSLALDGATIERLTRLVSAWALAGLAAAA